MKNNITIVTGGGTGIGAGIASAVASAGGKVLITGRRIKPLEETGNNISRLYGTDCIKILAGDICNEHHVAKLFDTASKWGKIFGLVNNAAIIKVQKFCDMHMQDFDESISVNIRAAVLCSKYAFNYMQKSGGGSILNISSLGGLQNTVKFPGLSAYVISKFAIIGLTEALAVEGKEFGIRVNCIAPGAVDTDMLRAAAPSLKTSTKPEDIGNIAVSIMDIKNNKLTGTTIAVHSNE